MSTPLVTIVTATYAKPTYFAEAAQSVLAQTFQDWVWWVVFNCWEHPQEYAWIPPFDDHRVIPIWYPVRECYRNVNYIPACIAKWIYHKVTTPYIYWLSDDDLLDSDGLGVLVKELEYSPGYDHKHAVYGRCEVHDEQPDGTFKYAYTLHPDRHQGELDIGLGTNIQPDCLIDGGQVLHTKSLWDRACSDGWELDTRPDREHAGHNDGLLLTRLAQFARFHYVPQRIVIHRRTRLSTWQKPQLAP